MRWYSIAITDAPTGAAVPPSSLGGMPLTSTNSTGTTNPSALNIQFEAKIANLEDFDSNSMLRIWGLGLKDISAALNLNGANLVLSAGMAKGLPLANPAQQGIILKGNIYQAFGNWVGTDQTLDLIFAATKTSAVASKNFPFSWKKGTSLATAIDQTLTVALAGYKRVINISPKLVLSYDETGYYGSVQQFSEFVKQRSKAIIGGKYPGVTISTTGTTVTASDGTVAPASGSVKQIAFQDMIGQPTWIGFEQISVALVMRGDLNISDTIHMPLTVSSPGQFTQTILIDPTLRNKSTFTGNFRISQVRHYGNFRQPDASSWSTVVEAFVAAN